MPLYWILTLTIAVLVTLAPSLFRTTAVNSQYLLKSLLFIPYQNPGHGADVVPILVPGWSLNMEMMFYLIFGLLLLAPRARLLPIATAVFGLLVLTHFLLGPDGPPVARFLTDLRITEFFLGMLIGALYVASNLRPSRILLAILLTGSVAVLLWQPGATPGAVISFVLATIIPSAAVVYAVVEWEKHYGAPAIPGLLALGNASYSLYLGHILALGVARAVWSHAGPKTASVANAVGFAFFGLALSVLLAIGLYRMLERPLTRELHRRLLPA